MQITRNITKDEEGNVHVSWRLSPEEASYFINYAINELVARGIVTVETVNMETIETEGGMQ